MRVIGCWKRYQEEKMTKTKYGKYLLTDLSRKPFHPEVITPIADFAGNQAWGETQFGINWECIAQPFYMIKEPHVHDFDEYLCFMGGNMLDIFSFDAEVELYLGEEKELHIITKPTIVYLPKGFMHCPMNFKRIDKPILFHKIWLAQKYTRSVVLGS
jgi:hypothetical protein